jgi:NADH-quinone oxidoreductase subunit C
MPEERTDIPAFEAVREALKDRFGDRILQSAVEKGELSFKIGGQDLLAVLEFLKNGLGFNALNDMIGLDHPAPAGENGKRFSVLYQLYKFPGGTRVRVAVDIEEREPVPSITPIFKSAGWAEREIFDLLGIVFAGHPDLRRIYLPEEFEGHPLRKDFPLEG